MRTEIHPTDDLLPADAEAADAVRGAAFGSDPDDPALAIQWADPDATVLARDVDGRVVATVGIVHRDGALDGAPVRLAGIGGVASDPSVRGRGFALAAVRRAVDEADARGADLAMLVCRPELHSFYARVGFVPFAGTVHIEQHGERVAFAFETPMVRAGRLPAPTGGDLDLRGRPW